MKKLIMVIAIVFALAAPMFAQSTFSDVPRDHWAYDAVSELESLGLVIGYPDGEFKGKRTMTRYEFAVVLCRLLPFLGEDGTDVSGFARKSDLDKYMLKDDYKPGTEADLSGLATADALNKIQALADEFASELAALGVDVNVLKADVAALKSRVAALEDEQARVKITGAANFMVKDVISGDEPAMDIDGYNDIWHLAKRKQSFFKDVQLDIKGRVNDKINLYTTLVMGDWANKNNFNVDNNTIERTFSSLSDITPYYMYAVSSDEKWGDIRIGRMPFQINNYLFKRYKESSYFDIDRLDDGNFSVEGYEYAKSFGAVDVKFWGNRPVYDWYDWQLPYFTGVEGEPVKVSVNLGGQVGFNFGDARITAVYTKMAAPERIKKMVDKPEFYGATLYVPFGQFYVDGGWMQYKPNKGYSKASMWDAKLGFANDKLDISAGYKNIESGYYGVAIQDKIFDTYAGDNYKGFYVDAAYNFTDAFKVYGTYKNYKPEDDNMPIFFDDMKYMKAGISYDVSALDNVFVEYEQAKDVYKDDAITVGWNRKVGQNAKIKMMYQYLKYEDLEKTHLVAGQLSVNF
ncbi:MAG: S-layer homology domain-containing protein [Abditibacteriota bacterium]|nr:S-layer homology domain-containing protein [Abditibacteriota bacterium]